MVEKQVDKNYLIFNKFLIRQENFQEYKPKKGYIESENDNELADKLNKIEEEVRNLKYSEDLPRLSIFKQIPDIGKEQLESGLFFYTCIGCIGGFGFSKLLYGYKQFQLIEHYSTRSREKKCMLFFVFALNLANMMRTVVQPEWQPQNWGLFAPIPIEVKIQNHLDLKYDLYKNVDKIKYQDEQYSREIMDQALKPHFDKIEKEKRQIWKELGL